MHKWLCTFLFPAFALFAHTQDLQELTLEGTLKTISRDSVLTIALYTTPEQAPKKKQHVSILKKWTMGRMTGTINIASGEILSFDQTSVKVQVLGYTSTMIQDSKRVPMIKPGDVAVLSWEEKPVPTYASELKKAEKLKDDEKYEEALLLLDSLIAIKTDEDALYCRGYCLYQLERYEASFEDLSNVARLNPEYQMARYLRALSAAKLEKYAEALADIEYLLALEQDDETETRLLHDHIYLLNRYEPTDKKERLCMDYNHLSRLEAENMSYYNDRNYYCQTYPLEESSRNYLPLDLISQSADKFRLETKPLKKIQYDWYGKSKTLNRKIEPGTYVKLNEIGEGYSANIAVAKVSKIENGWIYLDILYWSVRINDEPLIYDLFENATELVIEW